MTIALPPVAAWTTSDDVNLDVEQIASIELSGLAEVVAGLAPGRFRLKTSSKIGVLVGEGWELRVTPHLAIPRLMFLLGYARDPNGWKRLVTMFEDVDDLLSAIASGFSWHATWAVDRGVLRGYVHRDERLHHLKGRVRFGDQLARSGGLPLPIEVSYDDFTEDILENRMLRTAATLLLRLPRVPEQARRRLLRLRSVLAEVSELRVGSKIKAPEATRLNERYSPALMLAELILASASVGTAMGSSRSTSFQFDMNKVFEDFVTAALGEALRDHGGELRNQVTQRSLDANRPPRLRLKPDLAWWIDGRWGAVLDVKYKPLHSETFPNADAYQMLAYTLAYGLDEGWLVYARSAEEQTRRHEIPSADKRIVVTALDVRLEPEALLDDVKRLAADIAASLRSLRMAA